MYSYLKNFDFCPNTHHLTEDETYPFSGAFRFACKERIPLYGLENREDLIKSLEMLKHDEELGVSSLILEQIDRLAKQDPLKYKMLLDEAERLNIDNKDLFTYYGSVNVVGDQDKLVSDLGRLYDKYVDPLERKYNGDFEMIAEELKLRSEISKKEFNDFGIVKRSYKAVENMKRALDLEESQFGAFVFGAVHRNSVKNALDESGVSYAIITPQKVDEIFSN